MGEYLPIDQISADQVTRYEWEREEPESGSMITSVITGIADGEYYHPSEGMNTFLKEKVKIPEGFVKAEISARYMRTFWFNPDRVLLKFDNEMAEEIKELNKNATKYFTLDNGGRPFLVYVTKNQDNTNTVRVYQKDEDKYFFRGDCEGVGNYYTYLIAEYHPQKVHIGPSPLCASTGFSGGYGKKWDGNSILLETVTNTRKTKKIIHIGSTIYEFTMNDNITSYHSPVGNNCVPYPFAIGEKNVYFMLDCGYVPRSIYDQHVVVGTVDAYDYFYGHTGDVALSKFVRPMENMVVIHKPIW